MGINFLRLPVFFAIITATDAAVPAASVSSFRVTLHVFSGTPDPQWHIVPSTVNYQSILNGVTGHNSTSLASRLGYSGFTIDILKDGVVSRSMDVGKCTRTKFEMLLLDTVKDIKPEGTIEMLGASVEKYVRDQIQACPQ